MGNNRVMAALGAGLLALSLGATEASACSCQKEAMVKKYGSVSALGAGSAPAAPVAPAPQTPPAGTQGGG